MKIKKATIPFLILTFLHIVLLAVLYVRKNGKETSLLLLCSIGIAYVFEYFVLNLFKMYRYYPKIFKNSWIDNVFGAVLSQAVFVPIKATFLTLTKLDWKWKLGAGFLFVMVERIFIQLHVYKNKSWRTIYTLILIPTYFMIVGLWWKGLKNQENSIIPKISLFLIYIVMYTNVYYVLLIFRKVILQVGWVKDVYWDHFIVAPLYTLYLSLIGTSATLGGKSIHKLSALGMFLLSDNLMKRINVLRMQKWSVYSFLPVHMIMLLVGDIGNNLIKSVRQSK